MAWLVVSETVRTRRLSYVSKVRGVLLSRSLAKARRFPFRDEADRWAVMLQRDFDRGVGGQQVFVMQAPSDNTGGS